MFSIQTEGYDDDEDEEGGNFELLMLISLIIEKQNFIEFVYFKIIISQC